MKKLNLIKSLLDYLLLMSYIGLPVCFLLIILQLINPSEDYSIAFNGNNFRVPEDLPPIYLLIFVFQTIAFTILAYGLYFFRKMIITLQKRDFFSERVYTNLKTTGKVFILYAIINHVPVFVLSVFQLIDKVNHSLDPSTFVIKIIIGLFLISISEIIQISGQIKEENDLTV